MLASRLIQPLPVPLAMALAVAWGVTYGALWPVVMGFSQALTRPGYGSRALALTSLSAVPGMAFGLLVLGWVMGSNPALAWGLLLGFQSLALLLALSIWGEQVPVEAVAPSNVVAAGASGHWTESWKPLWAQWNRVALLLPSALAQTMAPGLLVNFLHLLPARLDLTLAGLVVPGLLALGAGGLTMWLAGRVADRRHALWALLPGLGLLVATYALATLPHLAERLWLLLPLLATGYAAFISGWNGLVSHALPGEHRVAAWGTVMMVEALGYAIGPVIGGIMWEQHGPVGLFAAAAFIFALTLGYYLYILLSGALRPAAGVPK
ncbi:MFS transporter [Deinococcus lacus]|uniref:MFS transporter n=1 Tax=Deinococcus lacus TaxID=392561 RepID=A0ABW1YD48_9DEIO